MTTPGKEMCRKLASLANQPYFSQPEVEEGGAKEKNLFACCLAPVLSSRGVSTAAAFCWDEKSPLVLVDEVDGSGISNIVGTVESFTLF